MSRESISPDVQVLVNKTLNALRDLAPPSAEFDHDTQDAIFKAIDKADKELRELSLAIHGAYSDLTG